MLRRLSTAPLHTANPRQIAGGVVQAGLGILDAWVANHRRRPSPPEGRPAGTISLATAAAVDPKLASAIVDLNGSERWGTAVPDRLGV